MVVVGENVYFSNSIGDISAVDINTGSLIWQIPTQSKLVYEEAFSLKNSDLVADNNSLYFSNNKNNFFSIDIDTGTINWQQKINSTVRFQTFNATDKYEKIEGYFFVSERSRFFKNY